MIQLGTISTGSAHTCAVVGAYWISSISRFLSTTLPGVTATLRPTTNCSVPGGGMPAATRCRLVSALSAPRTRFWPPSAKVRFSATGLVISMFPGEVMSSHCRAANATSSS
jgi:hypothetical protein